MKTCYIVGAGEFYGGFNPNKDDLVIAADGGYAALISNGITPDLVIGDMDSLTEVPSEAEKIVYPVRKDDTDMRLAYLEGVKRGCSNFKIYGGTGGRSDHTYANYCLLYEAKCDGNAAVLYGKDEKIFVVKDECVSVCGKSGDYISVFAFGGVCRGVEIRGLSYELSDGVLMPGCALGVSNSFLDGEGKIGVAEGALIVIQKFALDK